MSVSTRGNELRVWELEGGSGCRRRLRREKGLGERSVRIRAEMKDRSDEAEEGGGEGDPQREWRDSGGMEIEARKQWMGFDDEVVIVLKESKGGTQALMVYDFT